MRWQRPTNETHSTARPSAALLAHSGKSVDELNNAQRLQILSDSRRRKLRMCAVHLAWDLLSDVLVFHSKHPLFCTALALAIGRVARPLKLLKYGAHQCVDNYYGLIEYCKESKARHARGTQVTLQP